MGVTSRLLRYTVTKCDYTVGSANGAGIQHQIVPTVLNRIHLIRIQGFYILQSIMIYIAFHVRKQNFRSFFEFGQSAKVGVIVVGRDHQIIR